MKKIKLTVFASIFALVLAVSGTAVFSSTTNALSAGKSSRSGCTAYNYSQGRRSSCVGYMQRMLNGISNFWGPYGYSNNGYVITSSQLTADNAFGPLTASKVRTFQGSKYLTADGIVGPKTWNALCNETGFIAHYTGTTDAVNAARSASCILY